MSGPTLYAQLLDRATLAPQAEIAAELHGYLAAVERDLAQRMADMLRAAYVEGVRDGFHEGLAAAVGPGDGKPCERCDGSGITVGERHGETLVSDVEDPCRACGGSGVVL